MVWRSLASSAPNGSSRRSTSGSRTSTRAMATRCCWPPESWRGQRSAEPGELDELERRPHAALISARPAAHPEPVADVAEDGHMREQRIVLEDQADLAPVRRHLRHVLAADRDRARIGHDEARDRAQQRRLAAAGRAEKRHHLALHHVEVAVPQHRERPEALADAAEPHVRRRRSSRRSPSPGTLPGRRGRREAEARRPDRGDRPRRDLEAQREERRILEPSAQSRGERADAGVPGPRRVDHGRGQGRAPERRGAARRTRGRAPPRRASGRRAGTGAASAASAASSSSPGRRHRVSSRLGAKRSTCRQQREETRRSRGGEDLAGVDHDAAPRALGPRRPGARDRRAASR